MYVFNILPMFTHSSDSFSISQVATCLIIHYHVTQAGISSDLSTNVLVMLSGLYSGSVSTCIPHFFGRADSYFYAI